MKIQTASIKNFTVFEDVGFNFCGGVNVFIGANATGKTHTLKTVYATTAVFNTIQRIFNKGDNGKNEAPQTLPRKKTSSIEEIFRPYDMDQTLLLRNSNCPSIIEIRTDLFDADFEISTDPEEGSNLLNGGHYGDPNEDIPIIPCVFFPARDVIGLYHGYIAAHTKREQALDRTFYDICVELSAGILRKLDPALEGVITELEEALEAKVVFENDHFFLESKFRKVEAQLIAEGHRKLATIVRLIQTGAIEKDSVLLWDEPEANLNPKLISLFARVIRSLAKAGVQVFVATHDYLLAFELSMLAEYDKEENPVPTKFFSFTREEENQEAPVTVQSADLLSGIENNLILDEFAAHYDREQEMYNETVEDLSVSKDQNK